MSGTDIADGATCYAMSDAAIAYGAGCLPACYAMSGTDIAYGAGPPIVLRTRYALPGTDIASVLRYALHGTDRACPTRCYAMSGTKLAYGATRSARDKTFCGTTPLLSSKSRLWGGARFIAEVKQEAAMVPYPPTRALYHGRYSHSDGPYACLVPCPLQAKQKNTFYPLATRCPLLAAAKEKGAAWYNEDVNFRCIVLRGVRYWHSA
eukprot:3940508-Rhodomonas_salina.1